MFVRFMNVNIAEKTAGGVYGLKRSERLFF